MRQADEATQLSFDPFNEEIHAFKVKHIYERLRQDEEQLSTCVVGECLGGRRTDCRCVITASLAGSLRLTRQIRRILATSSELAVSCVRKPLLIPTTCASPDGVIPDSAKRAGRGGKGNKVSVLPSAESDDDEAKVKLAEE